MLEDLIQSEKPVILSVDDDARIRELIEVYLTKEGWKVVLDQTEYSVASLMY